MAIALAFVAHALLLSLITPLSTANTCPADDVTCVLQETLQTKQLSIGIHSKEYGIDQGLATKLGQAELSEADNRYYQGMYTSF